MDYPISPVAFTAVTFDDGFWLPRLTTNREVTIPYDFRKCEETGRIDNFAKAAASWRAPTRESSSTTPTSSRSSRGPPTR